MGKTFGTTSPSSPSNEASNHTSSEFEILSPPSSSTVNLNENSELSIQDMRLSVHSAHFDILPNEIEAKLRALLNENLELKETLHDNNAAMSEQLSRLSVWQQEVENVQEQNRIKFEESREVIHKLNDENAVLRKELGSLKANEKFQETLNTLKKDHEKLTIINLQLTEELKTSKEQLEQTKLSKNHLIAEKQELLATNYELQTLLEAIQNSKSATTTEENSLIIVQPNKQANETLESGINGLLLQLQAEQQKRSALMAELMEERKMRSLLVTELNALKETATPQSPDDPICLSVTSALGQKGSHILNTIKDTELKLTTTNREYAGKAFEDRLSECRDRLHSLNVKDENLVEDLKLEIEELRQIIAQEQAVNMEDKANLNAAHQQFENLLQDYQQLLRSWESYEHEQAKKGVQSIVYYDIQVKTLKEEIDRLTAQLIANEETIAAKVDDYKLQHNQIRMMSQEVEKIPILQAQLEIYQTDFRMEREASEKLGQERDIAQRQVHQLEVRIHELSQELEVYRRARSRRTSTNSPVEAAARRPVLSPSSGAVQKTNVHHTQSAPMNKQKTAYYCPRCNMGFTELQPLENHVNYCLDGNDPFL